MLDRNALTKRIQSIVDQVLQALVIRFLPQWVSPNHLTLLRLVLVAPLAALLAATMYWQSLILFVFLSLLDVADGALARTRDEKSELGKVLDPLADKVLVGSTLLILGPLHLGWGIIIAVFACEVPIVVGGLIAKQLGLKPEANLYGKLKMDLQVLAIVFLMLGGYLGVGVLLSASALFFYVAILFAILSLFASALHFWRITRPGSS